MAIGARCSRRRSCSAQRGACGSIVPCPIVSTCACERYQVRRVLVALRENLLLRVHWRTRSGTYRLHFAGVSISTELRGTEAACCSDPPLLETRTVRLGALGILVSPLLIVAHHWWRVELTTLCRAVDLGIDLWQEDLLAPMEAIPIEQISGQFAYAPLTLSESEKYRVTFSMDHVSVIYPVVSMFTTDHHAARARTRPARGRGKVLVLLADQCCRCSTTQGLEARTPSDRCDQCDSVFFLFSPLAQPWLAPPLSRRPLALKLRIHSQAIRGRLGTKQARRRRWP
jgi:hypothetical protein